MPGVLQGAKSEGGSKSDQQNKPTGMRPLPFGVFSVMMSE
jgi:hypothetical protein